MEPDARGEAIDRLIKAVELNTQVLERLNDWRRIFFRGVVAGFGGLIGATILISLLFTVLEPLKGFRGLGPAIERLADQLESQPKE